MKYLLILAIFICNFCLPERAFNQSTVASNTFYVMIPKSLTKGFMVLDEKSIRDTNATTYIFGGFYPKPDDEKSFFLDVQKEGTVQSCLPLNSKVLSPVQVVDSLIKHGRRFIRSNKFLAVFERGEQYSIHPCKGEYLYMNYGHDE